MKFLISDYHAGCQIWQYSILQYLGHNINIDSFSGCKNYIPNNYNQTNLVSFYNKNISVINIDFTINLNIIKYISKIYDTIIVSYPPKFIDVFKNIKFKYPKILNVGHRLHIHTRNDKLFIENLKTQINNNEIILCSMSKYDTEYIKHYLDIEPIQLDVICLYLPLNSYLPSRNEILISPAHAIDISPFESVNNMNIIAKNLGYNLEFVKIKDIYPNYIHEDLIKHKATVLFPYSIFSISMIELYELNIPMFVPSKKLLLSTDLMKDVSLYPCYTSESEMIELDKPHPNTVHKFSPNSYNYKDREYWLNFAYFYNKENIIYWDSPEDLFYKISNTNLKEVSIKMKLENNKHKENQINNWKKLLEKFN